VAIPDFEAGAMENWGLLTFREETLLYDNATSSVADRKLVTKIIAHELAHQVSPTHTVISHSLEF
jgi:cystinyl aminopeptidase